MTYMKAILTIIAICLAFLVIPRAKGAESLHCTGDVKASPFGTSYPGGYKVDITCN